MTQLLPDPIKETKFNFFKKKEIIQSTESIKNIFIPQFLTALKNVTVISVGSYLFNQQKVFTFSQQLDALNTPNASSAALLIFTLYIFLGLCRDTFSHALDGQKIESKFSSVWVPIKMAFSTAIFIPYDNQSSFFIDIIKMIVKLVQHFN